MARRPDYMRSALPVLAITGAALVGGALYGLPLFAQRADSGRTAGAGGTAQPWMKPVPRAQCGKGDRTETGLQGQTTIAERMTGAVGQGLQLQPGAGRPVPGRGRDVADGRVRQLRLLRHRQSDGQQQQGRRRHRRLQPARSPSRRRISTPAPMWDPWESLKVNVPRKLLAAIQADSGNGERARLRRLRHLRLPAPVLKSSVMLDAPVKGHAGNFAPGRAHLLRHADLGRAPTPSISTILSSRSCSACGRGRTAWASRTMSRSTPRATVCTRATARRAVSGPGEAGSAAMVS